MNKERIEIEQIYPFSPSTVWKCLTDPALHSKWWAAGDVRAEIGHKFELDMGNFGKQKCEVLEVQHERLLKYLFAANVLNTTITWELFPVGNGTRLKLTHEGFNLDSPMGRQALDGMKKGWPDVLARMTNVLQEVESNRQT
jgi:uncharacterized protein YndB with AHSA1/START domain